MFEQGTRHETLRGAVSRYRYLYRAIATAHYAQCLARGIIYLPVLCSSASRYSKYRFKKAKTSREIYLFLCNDSK